MKSIKKRISLLKDYEKKWVAFNKDETKIIAFGKTTRELDKKLKNIKQKASILEYVPSFTRTISPSCQ